MAKGVEVVVDGRSLVVTNPDKVFFPARRETKLDLVRYYLAVGEAALRGVYRRPTVLKRYPDGAASQPFFQKRVPARRPEWLRTATVSFPSGRTAEELCPYDVAHIVWAANLGCLDLNPWAVRDDDLERPDELRVDLDPQPGVSWQTVREVTLVAGWVLAEHGMVGFPKTSGSRGMHINVRIERRWGFSDVRRAALALARQIERVIPQAATSAWWKQERGQRVFVDYNQNARDRTVASAYSVRANPEARVSCPLRWEEVPEVEAGELTMATVPDRLARQGDAHAGIDESAYSIEGLLEQARRDEASGLPDAPWPPHFPKGPKEPRRSPRRG
jgi:bifunctional non-homologous end joining protein LigD